MMLPDLDGYTNFENKPTGNENTPQHQSLSKQTATSMPPQSPTAESDAATHPSRTPMLQLPQNPAKLPPSLPLLSSALSRKGKDGPTLGTRLGGSTTHRDNRQVSPGQWLPASSSGAFTARGSASVPWALRPQALVRTAPVPLGAKPQSSPAAARAAALNPQALPYVPPGGGSPSIQDVMAHAEAALHQLKEVVEKESWHKQGIRAAVQRKEAELQGLHQELDSLAQNKQAGLEQLKQLMSQQQGLNAQLNQAQHDSDASSRQLQRLQKENMSVQDGVAEAQQAAQDAFAHLHDLEQQHRFFTQKQLQLQRVVQGLEAVQQTAKQEAEMSEGICQALDASLADTCAAANSAEGSASRHQAAAARLVQQCTEMLGIAPEQLFPGWVQRLEGQVRASYEQRLKTADRKAVMAQVDTAIVSVSAQNTSRSCGQRAAPTPSLDLKSVSLRATFDSLTDSNRGRNASARAASGLGAQVSAGHSARQPLSASDTHPSMATATNVGLPLASLSEEPDAVDAGAGYADHAAAQYSGSPTRKVPGEHKGSLSSRHGSGQYASGGSSGYSSGSSSYYSSSSNNSSRSSTPLPNMNNEDSSHGLEKASVKHTRSNRQSPDSEHRMQLSISADTVSTQVCGISAVANLASMFRIPALPLTSSLPSAGATPRSVSFQMDDDNDKLAAAGAQGAVPQCDERLALQADSPVLVSPKALAENAPPALGPFQQSSQELLRETSFAFAEANAAAQPTSIITTGGLDLPASSSASSACHISIHGDDINPVGTDDKNVNLRLSVPEAASSMTKDMQDCGHDANMSDEDLLSALIERAQHACNVADQKFEQGRNHVRKGLAGLQETWDMAQLHSRGTS
ncbi:TPA: hypothetical protein ACH3X2_012976 [Trebouxia sp. C0005]